ncbi:hypothetical protein [Halorientalis marina]|jgi:phenylpropionate dioxygenase-like ring-hydroxylating dioxygenase large terminal subunit|uniref:hypothetical protein n=1 Tax=Halorientalis marina TaxID=2931976 RepID=UPI001FF2800C|nr:hypothetical protein [Halorientalis marina]
MATNNSGSTDDFPMVIHDAWMAVFEELEEEHAEILPRFKRAFGYIGTNRQDREILTEVLPVPESETPYRPPVTTDEQLDDELAEFARLVAVLLEQEITQRLSLAD